MARKAKTSVAQEIVTEVVDAVNQDEVVVQATGPSLMSQLVQQVVEAETKTEEVKVKADKNEGVGQFIRGLIEEGLGNKQILEIVHEQYGNKNTTYACVAWYRNKMKKAGATVKKNSNLDWLQSFAKANGLSEEATAELVSKAA